MTSVRIGGDKRDRTADLLRARQALSQLSYIPNPSFPTVPFASFSLMVGLSGLEPPTSPLSGVRSNHLSYRPSVGVVLLSNNLCEHFIANIPNFSL